MANNTYIALDKATITTATQGITFTNIPQGYTDLILELKLISKTAGNDVRMRVGNGSLDGNANYSSTHMTGDGSTAGTSRTSGATYIPFYRQAGTSTNTATITARFQNYSGTSFSAKTVLLRNGSGASETGLGIGLWRSSSAIDQIYIYEDGNTAPQQFDVGTTATLYGIKAEGPAPKATGGAIYTDAEYYYHVFGATASFIPSQSLTADVLTIAGGGGGGGFNAGGGGGAGGHVLSTSQSFASGTTYTCTVGSGGTGGTTVGGQGNNGTNSNVTGGSLSLTAAVGGGGGGASDIGSPVYNGKSGGSGGGAGNQSYGVGGSATSGQGYAGGNGGAAAMPGGGGGAGGAGTAGSASANDAVPGGVGTTNYSIWAIATGIGQYVNGNYYIAAGGASGRGFQSAGTSVTVRAYGGGGINSQTSYIAGGLASSGSGGVGASYNSGATDWIAGAGGSGVVIVRYLK